MHHHSALVALLLAATPLSVAAPTAEEPYVTPRLRLIKTSEDDAGQWVTEEQKAALIKEAERNHFIDITDSQEVCNILPESRCPCY